MKILKYISLYSLLAIILMACEEEPIATHMEDYLVAEEFEPLWTDNFSNLDSWSQLPNDGDDMRLGNDPDAEWTATPNGLNAVASAGWHHRIIRDVVSGDYMVEFKVKLNSSSADFPKAGIFMGELGDGVPKLWLALDNYGGGSSVVKFLPGSTHGDWKNFGPEGFDVNEWQVIKAVKTGNTFTVYVNGIEMLSEEGDYVNDLTGNLGLSVEGCDVDFEYIKTASWTDKFDDLTLWEPKPALSSTWTGSDSGLNVSAKSGWNHRIIRQTVSENFTTEFKVKMIEESSTFPKAGIFIGDLGGDVPKIWLALDNFNESNVIAKFIKGRPGGEWQNLGIPGMDVKKWQTIRLKKNGNAIYIFVDGIRVFFEQGEYVSNIQGNLGLSVEGCEAEFEYIAYSED